MADKKDNSKLKELKIELLKQTTKKGKIKKEIARILTKDTKEVKKN